MILVVMAVDVVMVALLFVYIFLIVFFCATILINEFEHKIYCFNKAFLAFDARPRGIFLLITLESACSGIFINFK